MKKKKNQNNDLLLKEQDLKELQESYVNQISNNYKYNMEIDPENIYGFSETEKQFIRYYLEFKSVLSAGELCGLDESTSRMIFLKLTVQEEIRRLTSARAQQQFKSRLINLDELGGYLTCLLTGENVPIADQLKSTEKLKVVDQIIKLNELKKDMFIETNDFEVKNFDDTLKTLSIDTIKNILKNSGSKLTNEDIDVIKELPVNETIKLLNDVSNKK